jgi:RimJ/RimL family protein N-acetyltransferase
VTVLETERLTLRPYVAADAPHVLAVQSRVEVVRWLDDGPPRLITDLDGARAWISRHASAEPPYATWAIVPHEVGHPVGSCLLAEIPTSDGLVQIGWHLHPDAWGHGYAAEAARAVLEHGLGTLQLSEIRALTHLDNHASMAVARRIGMRHLGVTHDWYEGPSEVFLAP